MYYFIRSKVTYVNCSVLFCVVVLFFVLVLGVCLFTLVVFVVLSAGYVMGVDFNFSF